MSITYHFLPIIRGPMFQHRLHGTAPTAGRIIPGKGPWHEAIGPHSFFGAVLLTPNDLFTQVNGYSNMYWGWGREDADLRTRYVAAGITLGRRTGTFLPLDHADRGFTSDGKPAPISAVNRASMTTNGLRAAERAATACRICNMNPGPPRDRHHRRSGKTRALGHREGAARHAAVAGTVGGPRHRRSAASPGFQLRLAHKPVLRPRVGSVRSPGSVAFLIQFASSRHLSASSDARHAQPRVARLIRRSAAAFFVSATFATC